MKLDKDVEKALVTKAKKGDKEAFRELVEAYQTRIFHAANKVLKSEAEAEEVAQESFVKAYLNLDKFKGDSSFYTWLYRITFNMAIDVQRKLARRGGEKISFEESFMGEPDNHTPDKDLISKESRVLIQNALNELSEEHRNVVVMRDVEGFSYSEIAKIIGVNSGTVMSRIFYARKKMREYLKSHKNLIENFEDKSLKLRQTCNVGV